MATACADAVYMCSSWSNFSCELCSRFGELLNGALKSFIGRTFPIFFSSSTYDLTSANLLPKGVWSADVIIRQYIRLLELPEAVNQHDLEHLAL